LPCGSLCHLFHPGPPLALLFDPSKYLLCIEPLREPGTVSTALRATNLFQHIRAGTQVDWLFQGRHWKKSEERREVKGCERNVDGEKGMWGQWASLGKHKNSL